MRGPLTRHVCASLPALACAAAIATAPEEAASAAPALSANIVFTADAPATGGHFRINVMNTDGTGTAIRPNPGGDYDDVDPAWSPDGTRIAFASDRGGDFDIYRMNADGSGLTRLTTQPRNDRRPAWSADGTRIAYRGYAGQDGGSQIFVMQGDGSGARPLAGTFGGDQPTWSPDSARIAFTRTVASGPVPAPGQPAPTDDEIYVTSVEGSGAPIDITNSPGTSDRYPAWSPDAATIAFRRLDLSGGGRELHTVSPGGGPVTNLTPTLGPGRAASWSPDGHSLVFVSHRDNDRNQEIWLGSLDGRAIPPRQLTFTTWSNDGPRWANVPVTASPVPPSSGGTRGAKMRGSGDGTVGGGTIVGSGHNALALRIAVPAQRLGRNRRLLMRARCTLRCGVIVRGEARIRGAGRTRVLRLASAKRTLDAGLWVRLRVRIPAASLQRIRRTLRRHRAVRVSLNAMARTSAGAFTPAARRTLVLKR